MITRGTNVTKILQILSPVFGNRVSDGMEIREKFGSVYTYHITQVPDLVVRPQSVDEIKFLLEYCHHNKVPLVPFGSGTSFEGQVAAVPGGITLDCTGLNKIIEINTDDGLAIVQCGVLKSQLEEKLKGTNWWFPVGPSIDVTIGGMVGTNASGTNAVRYGATRESVVGLTVVLPGGKVLSVGSKAKKSSVGYNLMPLFIGSEGTLGVVTEIILKLHPRPMKRAVVVCSFPTLAYAVKAATQLISENHQPAKLELLDEVMVKAINQYGNYNYPENCLLFIEYHGTDLTLRESIQSTRKVATKHDCITLQEAFDNHSINQLWQARKDAAPAALAFRPGSVIMGTDSCVPMLKLAACIDQAKADSESLGLVAPIVGHVGDGNFHLAILIEKGNADEMQRAKELLGRLAKTAIRMGGVISGEHGIGIGKREFMYEQHGYAIDLMKQLKLIFDPHGIMNPGKLLPD